MTPLRSILHAATLAALSVVTALALGAGWPGDSAAQQQAKTERVSVASDGSEANGESSFGSISGDGRFVAFSSLASNLVPNDENNASDVFVRDREQGTTERVSIATDGTEANGGSSAGSISATGQFVVFYSIASNLVADDSNGTFDVFVHDRETGTTERVSVATGGAQAHGGSSGGSVTPDGRYVTFGSGAADVVPTDTNGNPDTFVRDRLLDVTERISVATDGSEANDETGGGQISSDGRYVLFGGFATNLIPGGSDPCNVFLRDRLEQDTYLVSVSRLGVQGDACSFGWDMSGDGRYISFISNASNLSPLDENGSVNDVFLRDRLLGITQLINLTGAGQQPTGPRAGESGGGSMSADGRFVAFHSLGTNLAPNDDNEEADTFVRDRRLGTTELVSVGLDGDPAGGSGGHISADGSAVLFASYSDQLVPDDTNGVLDLFVRDRTVVPLPDLQPGDVSCTGDVDSIDGLLLLQFAAYLSDALPCAENGDVNQDGAFDALDALLILQYAAGLIANFPT